MEKKPRTTEHGKQSQRRISRHMNKHWTLLSIGSINSALRDPQMTHPNTHPSPEVLFCMQHLCSILSPLVRIQMQSTELFLLKFFPFSEQVIEFNWNHFFFLLKSALYILQLQNLCLATGKPHVCDSQGSKKYPSSITNILTSVIFLMMIL